MDHDEQHSQHHDEQHRRHGGEQHGGPHGHGAPEGRAGASWAMAAQATLHCLTGCAIGEILGMVIGTALGWGNVPTMVAAIVLAFLFGYSFTLFAVRRAGLDLRAAVKVALAADTVSIAVMELVDNSIVALVPGAMDAQLSDGLFWTALLGGFVIAFLITTPVNKWMIGRGKGHAVAHSAHSAHA
ncbi:DUF4396 domain-containing protein [Streptomyces sp. NBC_00377]|uniref:DUF4396 domain-containing protein n=1 Tax=unclassified Streptomyces TaxID=2593676 RepID=UPI002E1E70BA|nr:MULTISPECIES: DUF4396 domain-containing protein [unclassified Streptomyces]